MLWTSCTNKICTKTNVSFWTYKWTLWIFIEGPKFIARTPIAGWGDVCYVCFEIFEATCVFFSMLTFIFALTRTFLSSLVTTIFHAMAAKLFNYDYNISIFVCALPLDVDASPRPKVVDGIDFTSSTNSHIVRGIGGLGIIRGINVPSITLCCLLKMSIYYLHLCQDLFPL